MKKVTNIIDDHIKCSETQHCHHYNAVVNITVTFISCLYFLFTAMIEPLIQISVITWLKTNVDSAKPSIFLKIFLNNISKAEFSFTSGHLTKFNQIDHEVLFAAY